MYIKYIFGNTFQKNKKKERKQFFSKITFIFGEFFSDTNSSSKTYKILTLFFYTTTYIYDKIKKIYI